MGNVLRSFNDDTICAIATAMTDAGIGIIRVSGNDAVSICNKLYISGKKERDLTSHEPNTIRYGYIVDGDRIVDEVMISFMKAPFLPLYPHFLNQVTEAFVMLRL